MYWLQIDVKLRKAGAFASIQSPFSAHSSAATIYPKVSASIRESEVVRSRLT